MNAYMLLKEECRTDTSEAGAAESGQDHLLYDEGSIEYGIICRPSGVSLAAILTICVMTWYYIAQQIASHHHHQGSLQLNGIPYYFIIMACLMVLVLPLIIEYDRIRITPNTLSVKYLHHDWQTFSTDDVYDFRLLCDQRKRRSFMFSMNGHDYLIGRDIDEHRAQMISNYVRKHAPGMMKPYELPTQAPLDDHYHLITVKHTSDGTRYQVHGRKHAGIWSTMCYLAWIAWTVSYLLLFANMIIENNGTRAGLIVLMPVGVLLDLVLMPNLYSGSIEVMPTSLWVKAKRWGFIHIYPFDRIRDIHIADWELKNKFSPVTSIILEAEGEGKAVVSGMTRADALKLVAHLRSVTGLDAHKNDIVDEE